MRETWIGVDVSKRFLDVHIGNDGAACRVGNDPAGLATLVSRLGRVDCARVVMEASGGLERGPHQGLHTAGFVVSIVNPARVRHFAKAMGRLAKLVLGRP